MCGRTKSISAAGIWWLIKSSLINIGCLAGRELWGAWQKEGRRRRRKLKFVYLTTLCQCPLWTDARAGEVRRQQGQESERERERDIYCRLNSVSLQQLWLCQRGFDLSLEEQGCSESLGFYNKMHHYPEIIPSSECRQQISYYCLGEAKGRSPSLSLRGS